MKIAVDNLKSYENIYLGFSGGADSTALAYALVSQKMPFTAVHFHHHLRNESADKDAIFCRNFCEKYKISFLRVDLHVLRDKKSGESIESAARRLRQEWWQQNIEFGKSVVLLAHHKDDQRENFVLRSLRGSSSTGLTGFSQMKEIQNVNYFRPLFNNSRSDIISYLKANNLSWREDESNEDLNFNRNRVRHNILPELAELGSLDGLDRTIANTAKDADFLEESSIKWLRENDFSAENFLNCHDALKARIIRYFIKQETGEEYYPGHEAVSRLITESAKTHEEPIEIPLTDSHIICLDQNGKFFIPSKSFSLYWNWQTETELKINDWTFKASENEYSPNLKGESFLFSAVPAKLTVRSYEPGDRLIPFNRESKVKVKKLFNDRKLTAEEKLKTPLLIANDEIIWIPGVKRSSFGLAKTGDKVLTISYERI